MTTSDYAQRFASDDSFLRPLVRWIVKSNTALARRFVPTVANPCGLRVKT